LNPLLNILLNRIEVFIINIIDRYLNKNKDMDIRLIPLRDKISSYLSHYIGEPMNEKNIEIMKNNLLYIINDFCYDTGIDIKYDMDIDLYRGIYVNLY